MAVLVFVVQERISSNSICIISPDTFGNFSLLTSSLQIGINLFLRRLLAKAVQPGVERSGLNLLANTSRAMFADVAQAFTEKMI
jgi:hypothetical protein